MIELAETNLKKKQAKQLTPEEILTRSKIVKKHPLTCHEATDEIISIFCELHGGVEAAMPMIANQFKKANVDFANPTKEGLTKVASGLVGLTKFLKGEAIAEMERKRFDYLIKLISS